MRQLLLFLCLWPCLPVVAQLTNGTATTTYIAADACGNDANGQYFIMTVVGTLKYSFTVSPPLVTVNCPANGSTQSITAYTGNPTLVAQLNTKTGGCGGAVFQNLLGAPYNGQANPGTRLMLFTSPNPDISALPANAFADLCGGAPVLVACGNYSGTGPFFPNNNPFNSACGAYTNVDFSINGITQQVQYVPKQLAAQDGAYVGINGGNIRCGIASNCSCPGLSCPSAPNINIDGDISICEGERTTLTADAGAGYMYKWSNGESGASVVVGPELTTTYYVTVTHPSAPQCQYVKEVKVTVFNFTDIGITTMGETGGPACYGEKLYLRTVGGNPIQTPFTYQWTPPNSSIVIGPDESIIINEQTAGLYKITFTFNNGCAYSKQIEATYPARAPVKMCSNAPLCTGESLQLQVSTPGTHYQWSGPNNFTATGAQVGVSNPEPGQYVVMVKDSSGCTQQGKTIVVINACTPAILTASATATNTSCGLGNGTATASAVSGTSPYTYNWSHTTATNDPATFTGLSSGTYTVTVTDVVGATATSTVLVQGSSAPDIVLTPTATSCGNFNGAIATVVTYGTQPFSFAWNDLSGSTQPQQRTNLASGTYSVTVTDAVGCTNTTQTTISGSVGANASGTVSAITCAGANNGSIDMAIGGGGAPYTFDWSDLNTPPEPISRANLAPGTYSLTVTASNGCTATYSATLTAPLALTQSVGNTPATCGLSNGALAVTAQGGTGALVFDWADLPGTSNPQNRTGLSAGSYGLTITDANGCTVTWSGSIAQMGGPTATSSVVNVACFGNATGNIQLTTNSGTAPYLYNWADISSGVEPEDRANLVAGTYSVTITDVSACTWSQSFVLSQPASALTVAATTTNATCGSSNGTINLTINGGNGTYTFDWADITSQPEPQNRTGLTAGTYAVTVTDANACTTVTSATIAFNGQPSIAATTANATCGNPVGSINLTISGDGSPYSFNWADIATGPEPEDRTGLSAGAYSVTVTGSTGCTSTGSWTLTNPGQLNLFPTVVNTSCGLHNGSISVNATGSTPYNFDWAHIPGTSNSNTLTNLWLLEGGYSLTVSNATCSTTAIYNILVSDSVKINSTITPSSCGLPNGAISLSATGIAGATYTYDWLHIPGTNNPATITGLLSSGYYEVTVWASNGCSKTKTFGVPTTPAVTVSSVVTNARCGSSNGKIDLTVTGGTTWTYNWSHLSSSPEPKNVSNLGAGTYTVTVTNNHGCTTTHSKSVTQLGGAISSITGVVTSNSAPSSPPNGAIDISFVGGIAPFSFMWSNGATTEDISQISAGIYTVTVTGTYGCSRTRPFSVNGTFLTDPGNPGELGNQGAETISDGVSGSIELDKDSKVEVFPNPATESFRVVVPETMGLVSVDIFDASTRLVKRFEGRSMIEVQCGEWPAGNFTVRIISLDRPDLKMVSVNVVVNGEK
jgi:hypothetical protein